MTAFPQSEQFKGLSRKFQYITSVAGIIAITAFFGNPLVEFYQRLLPSALSPASPAQQYSPPEIPAAHQLKIARPVPASVSEKSTYLTILDTKTEADAEVVSVQYPDLEKPLSLRFTQEAITDFDYHHTPLPWTPEAKDTIINRTLPLIANLRRLGFPESLISQRLNNLNVVLTADETSWSSFKERKAEISHNHLDKGVHELPHQFFHPDPELADLEEFYAQALAILSVGQNDVTIGTRSCSHNQTIEVNYDEGAIKLLTLRGKYLQNKENPRDILLLIADIQNLWDKIIEQVKGPTPHADMSAAFLFRNLSHYLKVDEGVIRDDFQQGLGLVCLPIPAASPQ